MKMIMFALVLCFFALAGRAQTVGFITQTTASEDGYVLFAPIMSNTTYLVDKCGRLVHTWASTHKPGQSVYLLPDGTMLRPGSTNNSVFTSGGNGGILERFDWNGSLLWSYTISDASQCQHHDVCYLPNGNIIAIVWELKTGTEAINAGRNPSSVGTTLWSEKLVELHPTGATATIVWEWHAWDHLVQDFDNTKPAYDTVANHPERININYHTGPPMSTDWLHINSVSYNPALDQVMLSVHNFNELWIIDHSSTTAEAATHIGGAYNKGGDLLYRWGNPETYNRGTVADRKLFGQHNAHWIENGMIDSGKIMVFNNGSGRPAGNYSTIEVIAPPVDVSGNYSISMGSAYLPDSASWQYKAPVPTDFYGANISGAQRLASGNTLICVGPSGILFEIDTTKNIAWKYIVPVNGTGAITQGTTPAQNLIFRCTLYSAGYTGFTGHTLAAGNPIEINPLIYECFPGAGVPVSAAQSSTISVVNPFDRSIVLTANEAHANATITLTDMQGRVCSEWKNTDLKPGVDLELQVNGTLSEGVYLLRVTDGRSSTAFKLINTRR